MEMVIDMKKLNEALAGLRNELGQLQEASVINGRVEIHTRGNVYADVRVISPGLPPAEGGCFQAILREEEERFRGWGR